MTMSNKTMYINDDGDVVISADEMDAAGVKSVKFIEVKPTEAGSGNYESRIMKLKGDSARGAAVKIAAEADARITELEARLAEAKRVWEVADDERVTARAQLKKAEAEAASLRQQLADARDYNERAPKLAAEVGNARAEKAEAEAARLQRQINDAVSILSDMHYDEGCQFKGARGKDVGCLACLAQIALNGPTASAEEVKE